MTKAINLDAISGTKPVRSACMAAIAYYEERFGSISSPHSVGAQLVVDAKKQCAVLYEFFGVPQDDHFSFSGSGAESVSELFMTLLYTTVRNSGKNHFVIRAIDEAPAILAASALVEDEACMLTLAPIGKNGYMTSEGLIDSITPRTALISFSLACGLTGVVQPVDELVAIAKARNILVHIDATHAIGKMAVDFEALGCDFLTFNGEQFHSIGGTGGLFSKKEIPLRPLIYGKPLHTAHLAALAASVSDAKENELLYCTEVARLRAKFEQGVENLGAKVLFQDEERLPHITTVAFEGIKGEALLFALNRKGILASMGGGSYQLLQRVLEEASVALHLAQSALTFSFSVDTTENEIDRSLLIIAEILKRLKKNSKFYFPHVT